jgi:hypothetical protein
MHVAAFKDDVLKNIPTRRKVCTTPSLKRSESAANSTPTRTGHSSLGENKLLRKNKTLRSRSLGESFKKNRTNLERFVDYSLDQALTAKKMMVEDLFLA